MGSSDWSSDVCSSDLADQFELMLELRADLAVDPFGIAQRRLFPSEPLEFLLRLPGGIADLVGILIFELVEAEGAAACKFNGSRDGRRVLEVAAEQPLHLGGRFEIAVRSEEHTSELQSLMRISYAVF